MIEHISVLKNMGRDKKCLLVGNGLSVRDFDFEREPIGCIRIGMSITRMICDCIVYYDREGMKYYSDAALNPRTKLIGFRHGRIDHTSNSCSHYYNSDDMVFGDTGFHTLQFADRIFNFEEIYLIGYDYYTNGESYHFDEEESDPVAMKRFMKHGCGDTKDKTPEGWKPVVKKYEDIEWKNKIYNCNKESALKVFPFKNIY